MEKRIFFIIILFYITLTAFTNEISMYGIVPVVSDENPSLSLIYSGFFGAGPTETNQYYLRIGLRENASVFAPDSGVVEYIGHDLMLENKVKVIIDHGDLIKTEYIVSNPLVEIGDQVQRGQIIGSTLELSNRRFITAYAFSVNERYIVPTLLAYLENGKNLDQIIAFNEELFTTENRSYIESLLLNVEGQEIIYETMREDLHGEFQIKQKNHETNFHYYELNEFSNESFEITFWEEGIRWCDFEITNGDFILNRTLQNGSSINDIINELGHPRFLVIPGISDSIILTNFEAIYNTDFLDINDIEKFIYYSYEAPYNYTYILNINNGQLDSFSIQMSLP